MSERKQIDLALGVLDQQLVDWEGRRCGRVVDVELGGEAGRRATVDALIVGPAPRERVPLLLRAPARLVARVAGGSEIKVRWSDVDEVTHVVKLKREARELGLGRGDDRVGRWLQRLPGA
jgi:sporulation protein YlmC with PRC-barrel domain